MTVRVRPGRPEDQPAIAAFTTDTFEWGDYVADGYPQWLEDDASQVVVAVDSEDMPIGVARVLLMSPNEAWAHAARVHPDHRRAGVGLAMHEAGLAWAAERGAKVIRLMTETWNEVARRQVAKAGYREVSRWFHAQRILEEDIDDGGPPPQTIHPATPHDVESAYLAWSHSDLSYVAHDLIAFGYRMRTMRIDDLAAQANLRTLWEAPAGWVVIESSDVTRSDAWIPWMVTIPDDAYAFVRAIVAKVHGTGVRQVEAMLPAAPWMVAAFDHAGFEIHPNIVWELPIT